MTKQEHIERHKMLHRYLDELVADWIDETGRLPSKGKVMELMNWSARQTEEPDDRRGYYAGAEDASDDDKLFDAVAEAQRIAQLELNQEWLIAQFDELHRLLCRDQNGTWQQRVEQVVAAVQRIRLDVADTHE